MLILYKQFILGSRMGCIEQKKRASRREVPGTGCSNKNTKEGHKASAGKGERREIGGTRKGKRKNR